MGTYVETSRLEWQGQIEIYDGTAQYAFEQISADTVFFGVVFDTERYVTDEAGNNVIFGGDSIYPAQSGFFLTGTDLTLSEDGVAVDGDIRSFQLAYNMDQAVSIEDFLFTFDLGPDTVTFDELVDTFYSAESFLYGPNGALFALILTTTWVDDLAELAITGTKGKDVIDNFYPDMRIVISGKGGNDTLSLDKAFGVIDGGAGADIIHGFNGDAGDDGPLSTLLGGTGDDTIYYYAGQNTINGQKGNDTVIFAGETTDGSASEALLIGKQGQDTLEGGGDKAIIRGNGGDDTLVMGAALTIATGGKDADTFEFNVTQTGLIRIRDFDMTEDVLNTNGTLTAEEFAAAAKNANGHTVLDLDDLKVVILNTDLDALLETDFLL